MANKSRTLDLCCSGEDPTNQLKITSNYGQPWSLCAVLTLICNACVLKTRQLTEVVASIFVPRGIQRILAITKNYDTC